MRNVVAYDSLEALKSYEGFSRIQDAIHFAESRSMVEMLVDCGYFRSAYTFGDLVGKVDGIWKGDSHRIHALSLISNHIRVRLERTEDREERDRLTGYLRRAYLFWSTITLLEEADSTSEDISRDGHPDVDMLVDLWDCMVRDDGETQRFRDNMRHDNLITTVQRILDQWSSDTGIHSRTIVIHGFYFITPIQERMIRVFEDLGYDLIFLIPYRERYHFANEIWGRLYGKDDRFQPFEDWTVVEGESTNIFGELLEGRSVRADGYRLVKYNDVVDFARDMESLGDDVGLYSPDTVTSNQVMETFFPSRYGKRKLLSLPIGGFINSLHRMWDPDTKGLTLDTDLLKDCFSSGWVVYNGVRSDYMMKDLEDVELFFKDCRTIEEWTRRLTLLQNIHSDIISRYDADDEDGFKRRWKNVLGNPFLNFSFFEIGTAKVETILGMIRKLIEYANVLFEKGEGRSIDNHLDRLVTIIDDTKSEGNREGEYRIVMGLISRMRKMILPGKYGPSDIVNALSVFLENEYEDDREDKGSVKPLYELLGERKRIHMCICDEASMPGPEGGYIWPLKLVIGDILARQSKRDPHPLISNTMFITVYRPIANRFLMYQAFESDHVTLSWIETINDKRHSPSPYIRLMSSVQGMEVDEFSSYEDMESRIDSIHPSRDIIGQTILDRDAMVPEAIIDYSICPRRYLYGYLLNQSPYYSSEFQIDFAIGGLIRCIEHLQLEGGFSKESIVDNTFLLFPYMTNVEKQNIVERTPEPIFQGMTRFDDQRYSDTRLGIRFPSPIWNIMRIDLSSVTLGVKADLLHTQPKREVCMYCPHCGYCPNSKFEVDKDGY